jgi:D-xylose transport system ATP-binding protein
MEVAMTQVPAGAGGALPPTAPLLSLRGICKSFGAVRVLSGIDLDVNAGEVVALVGDNGAGKSTLVKMLSGVHAPDEGTMRWHGELVRIATPLQAQELGIATVYQDLALCDNLDVVQNLFLGRELGPGAAINEEQMEKRSWELLDQLSAKLPSVRVPVAALSGGQRQTVAIARSLVGDPSVVVLDEPTAALGVPQTAEVLRLVNRLRDNGHGVILVSHNMADVLAVADRIAVLRLGKNNGTFLTGDVTHEDIVSAITGASMPIATPEDRT